MFIKTDFGGVHAVRLEPPDWPGIGPCVGLLIPECELQVILPPPAPALVNRPQKNRDIRLWIKSAIKTAKHLKATMILTCDTAEQLEQWLPVAQKKLPGWKTCHPKPNWMRQ